MKSGKFGFIGKAALIGVAMTLILLGSRATARAGGGRPADQPTGPKEQLLYSFHLSQGSDYHPEAGLIHDAAGNFYGTNVDGGSRGAGAVFELSPKTGGGWTEAVLHSFHSNSQDGRQPYGGLIFDGAGNLYGVTASGGTTTGNNQCIPHGCGTVFELSPKSGGGWTEKVLYRFQGAPDGAGPIGSLVFDAAGNLYGTTGVGGSYAYGECEFDVGCGTVFELSPQSRGIWTEKVLYSFLGRPDGRGPVGGLVLDAAGNLYGATSLGGNQGCYVYLDCGTVFEISPLSQGYWIEKVVYAFQFNGQDGSYPSAGVILDPAGNLYGTTELGGSFAGSYCESYGCGTVFELLPKSGGSWSEQIIHTFLDNGADALMPAAGMAMDAAGNLYGTTSEGGSNLCPYGAGVSCGTVFELSPGSGWTEKVLHSFRNGLKDGQRPGSNLIFDSAGNLYGTTELGGSYRSNRIEGGGTVFEVTP